MNHELRKALALITDAIHQDPSVADDIIEQVEDIRRSQAQARYTERLKQNSFPF